MSLSLYGAGDKFGGSLQMVSGVLTGSTSVVLGSGAANPSLEVFGTNSGRISAGRSSQPISISNTNSSGFGSGDAAYLLAGGAGDNLILASSRADGANNRIGSLMYDRNNATWTNQSTMYWDVAWHNDTTAVSIVKFFGDGLVQAIGTTGGFQCAGDPAGAASTVTYGGATLSPGSTLAVNCNVPAGWTATADTWLKIRIGTALKGIMLFDDNA